MNPLLKYLLSFRFLYMIFGGFFFYLLTVIIDPIFIPTVNMPERWCKKWVKMRIGYRTEEECVEFNNKVDELKYKHNRRMEKRRSYKMIGIFLSASVLTFLLILLNPSNFFGETVIIKNHTGAIATAVFYGVILGFIMPTLFQMLLPPPIKWLPEEFFEIQQARTELILRQIIEMSK